MCVSSREGCASRRQRVLLFGFRIVLDQFKAVLLSLLSRFLCAKGSKAFQEPRYLVTRIVLAHGLDQGIESALIVGIYLERFAAFCGSFSGPSGLQIELCKHRVRRTERRPESDSSFYRTHGLFEISGAGLGILLRENVGLEI